MILENDLVMGTFTHRTDYLPGLLNSVKKHLPHVPFIVQIADLPINRNFEELSRKFKETGKRYWLFLDDDIEFVSSDTLKVALKTMMRGRYAMVGCYSIFDTLYRVQPEELQEREIPWMPGYFQLVDSHMVGHIGADLDLPDPNTSIDTSYSVAIRADGFKIGMAPTYVYHTYKPGSWIKEEVIEPTNRYLMEKWGQFYFDSCHGYYHVLGPWPTHDFDIRPGFVSIDMPSLRANTAKLVEFQRSRWWRDEPGKVKLHLGSGGIKLPGFINCDCDDRADMKVDITRLPFDTGSIDEIICHHALEHIPYRHIELTLKEWARVLKPGGELDLGMPDLELVCRAFALVPEEKRWNWLIYVLYGSQCEEGKYPWEVPEDCEIVYPMCHTGGLSLPRLNELLPALGFDIIDSYNYDANGFPGPSVFVHARRV